MSALPSSLHSATLALIWSRTSDLISPVSPVIDCIQFYHLSYSLILLPEKRAKKPCVLLLMTSISCNDTVWTTSLRFCNSPSGHWTNLVYCNQRQSTAISFLHCLFPYIRSHSIIISCSCERASKLCDTSRSLVNSNNVTSFNVALVKCAYTFTLSRKLTLP